MTSNRVIHTVMHRPADPLLRTHCNYDYYNYCTCIHRMNYSVRSHIFCSFICYDF